MEAKKNFVTSLQRTLKEKHHIERAGANQHEVDIPQNCKERGREYMCTFECSCHMVSLWPAGCSEANARFYSPSSSFTKVEKMLHGPTAPIIKSRGPMLKMPCILLCLGQLTLLHSSKRATDFKHNMEVERNKDCSTPLETQKYVISL